MAGSTLLDSVANDLAVWLDQESTRIAAAMAPQGVAPFAADLSEEQKLQYYRDQLFNPDGSPNLQGRQQEMQRLGPQSFTMVYKAVVKAYPQLRLPTPPGMQQVTTQVAPPALPSGVPVPAVPRGMSTAPNPNITPIVPHMASGGIVTQPTVALIGEAGPEAVVPLPNYQPPDPDLQARLGNAAGPGTTPPTPSADEIQQYIMQAARQRGIDPNVALRVAQHEGTNPATGQFDSPAQQGTFNTGRSWWPFQLHYGGVGTPYEQYGTVAGMGNDFTAQTGWQPGDPRAWKDATDFALDQAVSNPRGWALWYGSIPAKVAARQGLPAPRRTA
jgi:hypothetical protein